ncbi:hypothetical protein [Streptodolium elevatio]|uniref:Uncharacterized protein n=1 Tax=Streptodolium elevatio TaxID=3157996 RepID=A0ABV3DWL4_9ACTN
MGGDTAWDRLTARLIEMPGPTAGLEAGLARGVYGEAGAVSGRYMCRACHGDLILRPITPGSRQQPHFRHHSNSESGARDCRAPAGDRQRIEREDQAVVVLRDLLVRAWPGVGASLEIPRSTRDSEAAGTRPALVIRGMDGQLVVIERPQELPHTEAINARVRAVRSHYGTAAVHVWFLAKDPEQFVPGAPLEVKPHGRAKTVHATVLPTTRQRAITAAGSSVYWLDGDQVLVPYGVHDFTHAPRPGENWEFADWRAAKQWHRDWRISHPLPDSDATRWGLVTVTLNQLTATKTTFDLRPAHDTMQRLAHVERARWNRRRADARELHAQRHTPPDAPGPSLADEPAAFPTAPPPGPPALEEPAPQEPFAQGTRDAAPDQPPQPPPPAPASPPRPTAPPLPRSAPGHRTPEPPQGIWRTVRRFLARNRTPRSPSR